MEDLEANAEKHHFNDDVEVRAHQTYMVEVVAWDAAAAVARTDANGGKSTNSFASSKTEKCS